jgi:hypothetical protein
VIEINIKNPVMSTTIITIFAVFIFLTTSHLRTGRLNLLSITIFGIVFWTFFYAVKYFYKKKKLRVR